MRSERINNIHAPEELLEFWRPRLIQRDPQANKGSYKKLLIIAGSCGMAGAAYFSGFAAFRCGIGMVKYLGPEENRVILQTLLPEAMYESWTLPQAETQTRPAGPVAGSAAFTVASAGSVASGAEVAAAEKLRRQLSAALSWADTVVLGPGLSQTPVAAVLMETVLSCLQAAGTGGRDRAASSSHSDNPPQLLILDADALNLIAARPSLKGFLRRSSEAGAVSRGTELVITPHVGEMARLCKCSVAEIKQDLTGTAARFAEATGVNVVLKDCVSAVAVWERSVTQEQREQGGAAFARKTACVSGKQPSVLRRYLYTGGSPALAKAGSGDVLTGILAGVWALTGGEVRAALPLAVWLHGAAGQAAAKRLGVHGTLARDIADSAGEVLRELAET